MGVKKKDPERMQQVKKAKKAGRKLKGLEKKGKLKKHVTDRLHDIRAQKSAKQRQAALDIEDDWVADRERHFAAQQREEILPLDMLEDTDINWEQTSFASVKRRYDAQKARELEANEEHDEREFETKRRRFKGDLGENEEELLPIKLTDGTIIRPTRVKEVKEEEENEMDEHFDDVAKRKELLDVEEQRLASYGRQLLANPQENVFKLRDMLKLCLGEGVHSLVREKIQQLATASMVQVWLDIVPGYHIRPLTDSETGGNKLKKETKKLVTFEEAVLRYYVKFLQFVEKQANRLNQRLPAWKEATFSHKMAILGMRSLCRLLLGAPHFNYATNIVTTLIKLTLSSHRQTVTEICTTFSQLFKEDLSLKLTLYTCRAIASLVKKKKSEVRPEVLTTLISLNIKEIVNEDKKSDKGRLIAKKYQIKKERKSKSVKKYDKQIAKLENDLKEVEAAETISEKMKTATQVMKHVFQIYFSIIRRMPNLYLLAPVLEGLSKFAHLLNVEFFEDIIKAMEELIDQKHLRLLDQIHCVNTVFVILSGEGQALNVDPSRFYRSLYRILASFPFENDTDLSHKNTAMTVKCLSLMINGRKKQVPISRAASFFRRCLCLAVLLDDQSALMLVALCRSFLIAHPKLSTMVEEDESEGGGLYGLFAPAIDDPDCSGALSSQARPLLKCLTLRKCAPLSAFAWNILEGAPSIGARQLNPQWTSGKPWELDEVIKTPITGKGHLHEISSFAQKTSKEKLTSKNVFAITERWVASKFS
ncbi:unnamed protein product, partial [Mesorhabditis belari]|uniref:NOC3-like protein n=1 Tax=Mesorhabditis belari TaxID=2138241 RepID=A0AAF3JCB4_9BILA